MIHIDLLVSLVHKQKVSFFNWTPPCLETLGTGTAPREHGATRFCEPESAETPTEIPTEIPSRGFKKVDTDKNELCPLKVRRWFQSTTESQKQCLILHSGNLTEQWKMDPLKMCFLLKMVIFHCYVSLPEGVYTYILRSWLGESSFQCRSYAFPWRYWEKSSLHSNANSDSYLKQDGSHEPECTHVRLRWTGHNQITVHLSAFFVCAAMTNTCLQDLSPTLFSDNSLQHLAATLLFRTSLQHSSPTLLYNNLYTFLQHLSTTLFSTTPLSDTIFQHFSPAFLYKTFLQHFSPTLLYNNLLNHASPTVSSNTLLQQSSSTLFSNTSLQHSSPQHSFKTLLYTTSQHFSTTIFSNTSLQHSSPTFLSNTSLQLFSTTLFPTTLRQQSPPTLFSNTPLQHFSTTLFSNTSLQHSSQTLL